MAAITPPTEPADLTTLPFDQYSRQFVVATLINAALRGKKKSLSIIDLGGHKGKTTEFMAADKVTILDVYDEKYKGYVKGDATAIKVPDNHYDVAVSFDVFEHIPRAKRQAFVNEALRVSRFGAFIAMPIDTEDGSVSHAEKLLNHVHHKMYGNDHPWLKEHIAYKIPNHDEVAKIIKKSGAQSVSLASNQITDWQLLQTLIFMAAKNPYATTPVAELNQWYNQHIAELELGVEPGYRRIYFITKDAKAFAAVSAAVEGLAKPSGAAAHRYLPVHVSTLTKTLDTLAALGRSFTQVIARIQTLESRHKSCDQQVESLEAHIKVLQDEINAIRGSASWRLTRPLRGVRKKFRNS
jgi:ubiquinone/menaquinone biosynthesis C-methylase UbiE